MYFDTHAHYDAHEFDGDRDAVIGALPGLGIELVVDPGSDLPSSRMAATLAAQYPHVYAAVGIHPEECADYDAARDLPLLRDLARSPRVVAIGEIGLDYHWDTNPPRNCQQQVFRDQMTLAKEMDLPVIVHDRDAHGDSLAIVKEFPSVRGVFHCFSGSAETAMDLVKRGWMLSFTGVITYKNARKALEAAAVVPLENLMLETDSPYMAPVPHRGTRNDSGNLPFICQKLAAIKGISPETCARATLENGKRFFRLN